MGAALAVVIPFFFRGDASGHDFDFHLASWMEVARQWREGNLYPHWAVWANYGFGEPRFIFYPPASYFIGAALSWVFPWKMVPGAFVWLALTLAGVAMFALARDSVNYGDATRAAVLYAVNPYHLILVYFRSAYAELLVSAVFPLVTLFALRLADGSRRALVLLALLFAATWLTNPPGAVIVTYSLGLMLLVLTVRRKSPGVLAAGAGALTLGFALAAFYVLPAAVERKWVNIAQALSWGLRPEENFLFTGTSDPEHIRFNIIVSTIAVVEIAVLGIAGVASWRKRHQWPDAWPVLAALGFASTVLMLRASTSAWQFLPELRFVQFPWRWLFTLNLTLVFFVAAAARRRRARWVCWGLAALVFLVIGVSLARQAWWDEEDVPALASVIAEGKGYEGMDEYAPLGADPYELPHDAPRVSVVSHALPGTVQPRSGVSPGGEARGARVDIEEWAAEHRTIVVDATQPATLLLRLLDYPAWRIEINGKLGKAGSQEITGRLMIQVPAGHSRVGITFGRTPDRTVGDAISAVAALLLAALILVRRFRPVVSG